MEIERSDVWQPKAKAKAARWTIEMVLALEHMVMDKDKERFKRVYARFKLIKLWGALRSHDSEAIPPSSIRYEEAHGLEAQIMRTKTTGAGRKVEVVHLFISSQAWLTYRGWVVEGLLHLQEYGRGQEVRNYRDFLMCLPTVHLRSFRRTMGILKIWAPPRGTGPQSGLLQFGNCCPSPTGSPLKRLKLPPSFSVKGEHLLRSPLDFCTTCLILTPTSTRACHPG